MGKEQEVQIPDDVRTRCPLVGFKLRQVVACTACEHFKGLSDRFPGSKHRFAVRYAVLCVAEPVKRELLEVE